MRVKVRKSFEEQLAFSDEEYNSDFGKMTESGSNYPQCISGSETMCMYSRPSAFGPPIGGGPQMSGSSEFTNTDLINRGFLGDSRFGYYPHVTPCYYDGEAWAELEYNPGLYADGGIGSDLDTLLSRITASYIRFAGPRGGVMDWTIGLGSTTPAKDSRGYGPLTGDWNCNTNSQQVTSSINLFGTTKGL